MSAETLAVLRNRVAPDFPLDTVRAITTLTIAGEAASAAWEMAGHAGCVVAWGGAYQAHVWDVPGASLANLSEAEASKRVSALCDCIECLSGTVPDRGVGLSADSIWPLFLQLLPLLLEILRKWQTG